MPQLTTTKVDLDLDIIPSSSLVAIEAAQLMAERINEIYIEPARIISERINEIYLEPMRQLGKALEIYNTQIIKSLAAACAIDKSVWKNLFTPATPFKASSIFGNMDVVEAEVVTTKEIQALNTSLPAVQSLARTRYTEVFEDFNMSLTIEGRFYYDGMLLQFISTNSKHGQLLKFLLENDDNYVTDAYLQGVFHPPDPDKGLGYVRDDLKRCLAKEGLTIEIYRNRDITNKGYKLVRLSRFSN